MSKQTHLGLLLIVLQFTLNLHAPADQNTAKAKETKGEELWAPVTTREREHLTGEADDVRSCLSTSLRLTSFEIFKHFSTVLVEQQGLIRVQGAVDFHTLDSGVWQFTWNEGTLRGGECNDCWSLRFVSIEIQWSVHRWGVGISGSHMTGTRKLHLTKYLGLSITLPTPAKSLRERGWSLSLRPQSNPSPPCPIDGTAPRTITAPRKRVKVQTKTKREWRELKRKR